VSLARTHADQVGSRVSIPVAPTNFFPLVCDGNKAQRFTLVGRQAGKGFFNISYFVRSNRVRLSRITFQRYVSAEFRQLRSRFLNSLPGNVRVWVA